MPCRKRMASSRDDEGLSWFLSSCGASVGFLTRYDGELRKPVVWCQGSQVPIRVASGSGALLSSHGRGIGPQDTLKTDSQESSPTPQFKSINFLALSFLYSSTMTSIHDYWKNHSFVPQPEKELESSSSTRLEAQFPYHDLRAMTRSPLPRAWRPDFPVTTRETP